MISSYFWWNTLKDNISSYHHPTFYQCQLMSQRWRWRDPHLRLEERLLPDDVVSWHRVARHHHHHHHQQQQQQQHQHQHRQQQHQHRQQQQQQQQQRAEVREMEIPSCFYVDKGYSENFSKTVLDILAFQAHHLMNQIESVSKFNFSTPILLIKKNERTNLVFWGYNMILQKKQSSIFRISLNNQLMFVEWYDFQQKLHQPRQSFLRILSHSLWMDSWMPVVNYKW